MNHEKSKIADSATVKDNNTPQRNWKKPVVTRIELKHTTSSIYSGNDGSGARTRA